MKRVIRTSMRYTQELGEVNDLPSKTVPDMAIPLSVLIDRYVRGIDLEEYREPYWQKDEFYVPDPKSLDLTDIENMRVEVENVAGQLTKDVQVERERRLLESNSDKLAEEEAIKEAKRQLRIEKMKNKFNSKNLGNEAETD